MTGTDGVVAAKALEILATLGHDRGKIAAQVGCHPRTVRRWETGQHQPSRRNRTTLRAFVGELLMVELAAPSTAHAEARRKRLNVAAEALLTAAEKAAARAEREEIADRMRRDMAAREQRRRAEQEQRDAAARAIRDSVIGAQRNPHRSVTYQLADPFDAIDKPAEPALPF